MALSISKFQLAHKALQQFKAKDRSDGVVSVLEDNVTHYSPDNSRIMVAKHLPDCVSCGTYTADSYIAYLGFLKRQKTGRDDLQQSKINPIACPDQVTSCVVNSKKLIIVLDTLLKVMDRKITVCPAVSYPDSWVAHTFSYFHHHSLPSLDVPFALAFYDVEIIVRLLKLYNLKELNPYNLDTVISLTQNESGNQFIRVQHYGFSYLLPYFTTKFDFTKILDCKNLKTNKQYSVAELDKVFNDTEGSLNIKKQLKQFTLSDCVLNISGNLAYKVITTMKDGYFEIYEDHLNVYAFDKYAYVALLK